MKKVIIVLLILCCSKAYANFLKDGDYYFSPDCIKVGKESTNKMYYFDELSQQEQDWLLNHKDAHPIYKNGKIYLNVTQMQDDLGNHGYGFILYPYNARKRDLDHKRLTSIHTYEEAGVKRINRTHRINIGAGKGFPATIHTFRSVLSIFNIW